MKNTILKLLLLPLFLLIIQFTNTLSAQSKSKQNSKGDNQTKTSQTKKLNNIKCCECDYYSVCDFKGTRTFDGVVYKVLAVDEENISYFNCDNGEFTVKWETTYTPDVQVETDYDPISKTEIITSYHQGKKVRLHTRLFLKCNEPEDTRWTSDGTDFLIVKKDTTITTNGVTYENVMVVMEGSSTYVYYAKGEGKVMVLSRVQYQRDLKSAVFEKGIINPEIIGTWVEDKHPGYWGSTFFTFTLDGTGEHGNYNSKTKVFGKPNPFKWTMINNTLYEQQLNCPEDVCFFEIGITKIETGLIIGKTKYKRL